MPLVFKRKTAQSLPPVPPNDPTVRYDAFQEKIYTYLKEALGFHDGQAIWLAGQKIHDLEQRALFYSHVFARVESETKGQSYPELAQFSIYKYPPVDIETFICDPYYLNKKEEIYPEVLKAAIEFNSGQYTEGVLTGGIGSGKTTLGLYTCAYQLYLLSCMRNPHKQFGLDPASEILFIFQSITKTLAQGVDYQRFRSMIETSKYFAEHYPFDRRLETKLSFENRVEVVPVSGSDTAAIGQNVIGGLIDELNYMAVVEKSKSSADKGVYDQAIAVYNSISRRRKSRFMENGKLPGILCLVSSKKYPGQFTDQKMEDAKTDKSIYVYDKRVWDIKPHDFGNSGWFKVFIGDMTRKPRILGEDETWLTPEDRQTLILEVPNEFKEEFKKDIINALREIGGVSTLARHPYFMEVDKVSAAFKKDRVSIFEPNAVDFVETRLVLKKGNFYKPELPRFVHGDLAISGDSAGLAIGTVVGFKDVSVSMGYPAFMPNIWIDGVLEIRPPRGGEILFWKMREIFTKLIKLGLNLKWVTFDQFQSTDSQQLLRQVGMMTGLQSMDKLPCKPYAFTKSAMYDGRLSMPLHGRLHKEILQLERDQKTGEIDHPPDGSKDCADALAGVVFGLTMRREIWNIYDIPPMMIPDSVREAKNTLKDGKAESQYQVLDEPVRRDIRRRLAERELVDQ